MNRPRTCAFALLALVIPRAIPADTLAIAPPAPGSLAFARYIVSIHRRDPFRDSGPVAMVIEASLPGLQKRSRLVAIRETGKSERSEYKVLESEGDPAVTEAVIVPYLAEQKRLEDQPLSSVIVTTANYNFPFVGEAWIAGLSEFVFRIAPKKKREGLIRGELWLDSETGLAVMQAGYFVKSVSADIRRMELVRYTKLQDGSPCSRTTRVAVDIRRAGRGYLTITEFPPAAIRAAALGGE